MTLASVRSGLPVLSRSAPVTLSTFTPFASGASRRNATSSPAERLAGRRVGRQLQEGAADVLDGVPGRGGGGRA
ncbi:MAG TPA: hypothetical protein VHZ03_43075 [Trebonia sp.]|nr:hypothetical protein [Trebonia sp.]